MALEKRTRTFSTLVESHVCLCMCVWESFFAPVELGTGQQSQCLKEKGTLVGTIAAPEHQKHTIETVQRIHSSHPPNPFDAVEHASRTEWSFCSPIKRTYVLVHNDNVHDNTGAADCVEDCVLLRSSFCSGRIECDHQSSTEQYQQEQA